MIYKCKNQPHQHRYFWTIVPRKTQYGKTSGVDERLFINLQQQSLYKERFYRILWHLWEKHLRQYFSSSWRSSDTLETLYPSLCHSCISLREDCVSSYVVSLIFPLHCLSNALCHLLLSLWLMLISSSSFTLLLSLWNRTSSPWESISLGLLSIFPVCLLNSSLILFLLMNQHPRLSP